LDRKDYIQESIESIYFGGGTPSLLSEKEIERLLGTTFKYFSVNKEAEITLEANPDDLSEDKIKILQKVGINRLSIGVQSFYEPNLRFMNRAHNAKQAENCIKAAQDIGIDNISLDLIYGIPNTTHEIWHADLQKAITLTPKHISSYCLTIEEKTVFGNWHKKGKITEVKEDFAAEQFEYLIDFLAKHDFQQYEISNFALHNFHSKHNSNYWQRKPYLGIGASAHSYNILSRQYNISNNAKYIKGIHNKENIYEKEILSPTDMINEYIFTTLRTIWGCDMVYLKKILHFDLLTTHKNLIESYIKTDFLILDNNKLFLTRKGKLIADKIALDFFIG
jgi:oxygen-independent coproporphyrinogen-3 oxidase